jgi:STE24 endopeptidase
MTTPPAPPTEQEKSARAFTKRYRWVAEFQFLALFLTIVIYCLLGFHERVAALAKSFTGNFYLQVALCWLPLWAVCTLVSLPGTCYGFFLQRKFGLATAALRAWLWDSIKANLLLLVFTGVLLEIVFTCHIIFPVYGWLCAGFATSLLLLGITRSLAWILSLFYPVLPLENASLRERLARLATKAGLRVGTIYEWKISSRTRHANALVAGTGGARRILLTDTLIAALSEDEMEAIVAHEFGHCALHHVAKRLLLQGFVFSGLFFCINFAVRNDLVAFTHRNVVWANLMLVPGLYLYWTCGRIYGNLILAVLSRKQEKAADLYSWKLTGRAEPFISGMRKLSELNLIVFDKSSEWRFFHPPTRDRIAAAEQFAIANGELATATGAKPSTTLSSSSSAPS